MRKTLGLAALGALVLIPLVSVLDAQDSAAPKMDAPSAAHLFNFHFEGKKRRGEVIELVQLDDPKYGGKALVITHLEMRIPQSMRAQLEEWWQEPNKKQRDGKPQWSKRVLRGDAFSTGLLDSTSEWIIINYDSRSGIVFAPATRPSIEINFGSGDLEVWADGYWATP
jgi:hypothetical protein